VTKRILPLIPGGLAVEQVLPEPNRITIIARPDFLTATCPSCHALSSRVHSRYERCLADLPWQGRPVAIRVSARRFLCAEPACPRRTFAERLPGIAHCSARRCERLADIQRQLALALGGEAGARLSARLAMPTSADTLLRLAIAATRPRLPAPRVLGVDEWAWRKGHRYGTILVDLERNKVVDLLPERDAGSFAAWLHAHPGVEMVARDRADVYADGARRGAPRAIHVADRWHLLRNLGEAVKVVVDRHHGAVRRAAKQVIGELAGIAHAVASAEPSRPTAAEIRRRTAHTRRQVRYEEAARLHEAGVPLQRIAGLLGAERRTVRSWLRAGHAPLWRKPPRGSILDPYREHLERRWAEGCRNAARLWHELTALGFAGRPTIVRVWATRRRKARPDEMRPPATRTGLAWRPPSGRRAARLLTSEPASLLEADQAFVRRLLADSPELAATAAIAARLSLVLRRKSKEPLETVLAAADSSPLASFAAGLRRDIEAVQAALELPWTTSPVEGQVNRLKTIKRSMYGRAGFPLLRQRVLHAA
jgi:transposase